MSDKVKETATEKVAVLKNKTVLIRFTKSPTGTYNLGYNIGDEVDFDAKQAAELVENDFAELVKK